MYTRVYTQLLRPLNTLPSPHKRNGALWWNNYTGAFSLQLMWTWCTWYKRAGRRGAQEQRRQQQPIWECVWRLRQSVMARAQSWFSNRSCPQQRVTPGDRHGEVMEWWDRVWRTRKGCTSQGCHCFSPMINLSFVLPPHLPHLKDVYEALPDPDRQATAPVSLETCCGPATTQPLHGAQTALSVILHKPPEAQDLDQNRGH